MVATARGEGEAERPDHALPTDYRYNTLNQVTMQQSPDGGVSKFWYDRLGRLVVSQNAKQAVNDQYSYTGYDALGRIVEVGQLTSGTAMTQAIAKDVEDLGYWLANAASSREQMTRTVYDVAVSSPDLCSGGVICQRNLRNRVSYSYVQPSASYSSNNLSYTSATYYTYDIHGNVDELLQHYNAGIMQSTGNA